MGMNSRRSRTRGPRRDGAHLVGVGALGATCLASIVAGVSGTTAAAPAHFAAAARILAATSGPAAGTKVTLTSKTVVINPATVASSLSSVSPDGSTYTFSNSNGSLGQLKPGKVLLLEGRDAVVVTSVHHSGAKLVVDAAPASLTDVVQSGQIVVNGAPDTAQAIGVELDPASPGADPTTTSISRAGLSARGSDVQLTGDTNTFAYQGTTGNFTYKVGFTGKSDGLHATGDFCYQLVASSSGSSCGNGLSINITLDGVFTWGDQNAIINVASGSVHGGSFSISNMASQIDLNYTVLRGQEPKIGADPPVLKIPFAFEAPLCGTPLGCAGLPLYSKFELALLIKLGISSKNSSIQGGVNLSISGSPSITQHGVSGVSGSIANPHVKGSFTLGTALTPGAAGIEVALQNKFGVGLGIKNINALYYLSAITAIGETTGSAVAAETCKAFTGSFSITGNAEAQLFGFTVSTPAKTLFNKKASYTQKPC
jgi:hypothetical protein